MVNADVSPVVHYNRLLIRGHKALSGGRRADDKGLWRTADGDKFLLFFSNTQLFVHKIYNGVKNPCYFQTRYTNTRPEPDSRGKKTNLSGLFILKETVFGQVT